MLVLSRRVAEKICIPELGITLEVVSIKGNSVRLGIDAPPEIRILREEVLNQGNGLIETTKKKKQKTQAANRNNGQPLLSRVRQNQEKAGAVKADQDLRRVAPTAEARSKVKETRTSYHCRKSMTKPVDESVTGKIAV